MSVSSDPDNDFLDVDHLAGQNNKVWQTKAMPFVYLSPNTSTLIKPHKIACRDATRLKIDYAIIVYRLLIVTAYLEAKTWKYLQKIPLTVSSVTDASRAWR